MKKVYIYILLLLVTVACNKPATTNNCNVLPLPQSVEFNSKVFTLSEATKIIVEAPENDKQILEEYLKASLNGMNNAKTGTIRLVVKDNIEGISSPEGYSMTITPKEITVEATSGAGLFYGIQTILQMAREGKTIIMISSEMPELLGMSDRIMVMCEGHVSGILDGKDATDEKVMMLASTYEGTEI